jgi:hypothetical protein
MLTLINFLHICSLVHQFVTSTLHDNSMEYFWIVKRISLFTNTIRVLAINDEKAAPFAKAKYNKE